MKQYLLSNYGERHEDRLPVAIFTDKSLVKPFLDAYAIRALGPNAVASEYPPDKGDYGDYVEYHITSPSHDEGEILVLDSFQVNPTIRSAASAPATETGGE